MVLDVVCLLNMNGFKQAPDHCQDDCQNAGSSLMTRMMMIMMMKNDVILKQTTQRLVQ